MAETSSNFCELPVDVARSSSDGIAICYIPGSSSSTDDIMFLYHGTSGQNQARRYVQESSRGGGTSWTSQNCSVWLSSSECGTGDEVCYLRLPCLLSIRTYYEAITGVFFHFTVLLPVCVFVIY